MKTTSEKKISHNKRYLAAKVKTEESPCSSQKTEASNTPTTQIQIVGENSSESKKDFKSNLNLIRVSDKEDEQKKAQEGNSSFRNRISLPPSGISSLTSSFVIQQTRKKNSEAIGTDSNNKSEKKISKKNLNFSKNDNANGITVSSNMANEPEVKPFESKTDGKIEGFNSPPRGKNLGKFSPENMKASILIHKKNLSKNRNSPPGSNSKEEHNRSLNSSGKKKLSLGDLRRSIKIPAPTNSLKNKTSSLNLKSCLKKQNNGKPKKPKNNVMFNETVHTSDHENIPINDLYPKQNRFPLNQFQGSQALFPQQNLHYSDPMMNRNQPVARNLMFIGGNNNQNFQYDDKVSIRQRDGYPGASPMLFDSMIPQEQQEPVKPIKRVSVVQRDKNLPSENNPNSNQRKQQKLQNPKNVQNPMNLKFEKKIFSQGNTPRMQNQQVMLPPSLTTTPEMAQNVIAMKQGIPAQQRNPHLINSPNQNLSLSLGVNNLHQQQRKSESFLTPRNRIGSPGKIFKKIEALHKKNMSNKIQRKKKLKNNHGMKRRMLSPQLHKMKKLPSQISGVISNRKAGALFINSPSAENLNKMEEQERRRKISNNMPLRETRPNMKHSFIEQRNKRDRINSPDPASKIRKSLRNKEKNNRGHGVIFDQDPNSKMINTPQQGYGFPNQLPRNHKQFSSFVHPQHMHPVQNNGFVDPIRMSLQRSHHSASLDVFRGPKFKKNNKKRKKKRKNPLNLDFRTKRNGHNVPHFNQDESRRSQRNEKVRFNSAPRNMITSSLIEQQRIGSTTPNTRGGGYGAMRPFFAQDGNQGGLKNNFAFGGAPDRFDNEKEDNCRLV